MQPRGCNAALRPLPWDLPPTRLPASETRVPAPRELARSQQRPGALPLPAAPRPPSHAVRAPKPAAHSSLAHRHQPSAWPFLAVLGRWLEAAGVALTAQQGARAQAPGWACGLFPALLLGGPAG